MNEFFRADVANWRYMGYLRSARSNIYLGEKEVTTLNRPSFTNDHVLFYPWFESN